MESISRRAAWIAFKEIAFNVFLHTMFIIVSLFIVALIIWIATCHPFIFIGVGVAVIAILIGIGIVGYVWDVYGRAKNEAEQEWMRRNDL